MTEILEDLVRRSYGVTVRNVDEKARSVDVIASTDAVDAYGEIVDQDWDLKRYLSNPVVLYNHNREGFLDTLDPKYTLPIGYAVDVAVTGGKLHATLCFVDEKASPMAELVFQGFRQGSLRAVSVGFRSRTVKSERINDKDVYRLSDNELYEISATPMGANPEAVAKSLAASHERFRARAAGRAPAPAPPPRVENFDEYWKSFTDEPSEKSVDDDINAPVQGWPKNHGVICPPVASSGDELAGLLDAEVA